MKFTWEGREHKTSLTGYEVDPNFLDSKSSLHQRAYALLKSLYPFDIILQEVPCFGTRLHIDLFVPTRKLAVECQGEQHSVQGFFHKNKYDFLKGQSRDKTKVAWCKANSIELICLDYTEDDTEWRRRLLGG